MAIKRNLIISALLIGLATACTTPEAGSEDSVNSIRLGVGYESATPFNTCGMNNLPESIHQAGGELDVEVYPDGVLGNEGEMLEQVVTGELDGAHAGPAYLGGWYEPAAVMESAYVFDSVEATAAGAESTAGQEVFEGFLEETGVRVLDTWWIGTRHLMTTAPVRSPDDLAGVRMRVPPNDIHMAAWSAMGASPFPVDLGEAYIGLQQGLISAVEGPLNTSDSLGFEEVINYVTLTGHVRSPVPIVIRDAVWQRIPEEEQGILAEQLRVLGDQVQECTEEQDAQILQEWVESGHVTVVEDADIDAFRDAYRAEVPERFAWTELYYQLAQ